MTTRSDYLIIGGQKVELKIREPPMTIIAALKETETSVLISSDIEGGEAGGIRLQECNKLFAHPKCSLAWGFSGNPTIGIEEFSPWLQEQQFLDWRVLRNKATEKLAELNSKQRELVELSKAKPEASDTTDCLLIGYLDRPEIYEFNDRGIATSYWAWGFQALGSGKICAWVAYKTLQSLSLKPSQMMKRIMDVVTSTAFDCGKPYYIWRVSKDGITKGIEKES